jgi:hypothetical protein
MHVRRFSIPVHDTLRTRERRRFGPDEEEATERRTFTDEPTIPDARFYSDDPTDRYVASPVKDR